MTGLEVCVDTIGGLQAAAAAGVTRIELCGPLAVGGTTPSAGLIHAASASRVPVRAMIRPRDGGFNFSRAEAVAMEIDIDAVRAAGLDGVVLGASRPDGTLDLVLLRRLCDRAAGLGRTLHRCFDLVPDPFAALDQAVALGFDRVLTSGAAPTALDGAPLLKRLVAHAAGRISIMAGSGLSPERVGGLLAVAPVDEIHASCRAAAHGPDDDRLHRFGFQGGTMRTDRGVILAMLSRIAEADASRTDPARHGADSLPSNMQIGCGPAIG